MHWRASLGLTGSAGLLVVDDFEARLFAAEAAVTKALSLAPRHPWPAFVSLWYIALLT